MEIRRVVIRLVDGQWEMSHTKGGLYNRFATFQTEKQARDYAAERGWKCTKKSYNGSHYVNPPKE